MSIQMGGRLCAAALAATVLWSIGVVRVASRQEGSETPAVGQDASAAQRPAVGALVGESDSTNAAADYSPKPPVLAVAPELQAERFWLPQGYRMEAVLADPDIEDPVQIAFDGNGRMFVIELRGYLQTLDGRDVTPPTSRISVHEDADGDGRYELHSIFADGLVLPRFVLPLDAGRILTMESNTDEVLELADTDGDGIADTRKVFTSGFGRSGHIAHQQSSLTWAMDNWLYSTYNAFRVRRNREGDIEREPTGAGRGQWGLSQDNYGKLFFQHGASGLPGYFQFPVQYGSFQYDDQFEAELDIPWGAAVRVADMQGGMATVRMPDGSLNRTTAGSGNDVFRGHRLPEDLVGDYVYGELVARVVRRLRPVAIEGLTQLRNVYPSSEFVRSTDPLFRPVEMSTAPDGTLYIVDMYRGVVEGAPWAREGTYLRRRIEQYQLDKVVGHGRVWRLTYDGIDRDSRSPRMFEEASAELVAHLEHPNGWWRDTAQMLIVLRQDPSVGPALVRMARQSRSVLGRIHALWALEGLGQLDARLVRDLMTDSDPVVRIQATRASETLYKAGDRSFAADYEKLTRDDNIDVVLQAILTVNVLNVPERERIIGDVRARVDSEGVQLVASQMLAPVTTKMFGGRSGASRTLRPAERAALDRGAEIYQELCYSCHGADGRGSPMEGVPGGLLAPALVASPRVQAHRDYVIHVLLHGLTGPLDGRNYPGEIMVAMGENEDEWVAAIGSYIRSGAGRTDWLITAADVARVRQASVDRTAPWTLEELRSVVPRQLQPLEGWHVTASHNGNAAPGALAFVGWTSGEPQEAGMWFQVDVGTARVLSEVQFDSPPSNVAGSSSGSRGTFPRAYEVRVSSDLETWSEPVARGRVAGPGTTAIAFPPTSARAVRITLTEDAADVPWSIRDLKLFHVADATAGGNPE